MIAGSNIITEELYELEIPIVIEKNWSGCQYISFAWGIMHT